MTQYRYLGLLAALIVLGGLSFIVWRWPQGKHLTFSQHVAVSRHTILYYIALFSVVLPLLLLFFIGWFAPTFHLPLWFNASIIVSSLTQYACTLIPEVGGWKTQYHRLLAGVSALFLIPPMLLLLVSEFVGPISKVLVGLGGGAMVAIVYTIARQRSSDKYSLHPYSLLLQSAYFVAFFVPVLYISYVQ